MAPALGASGAGDALAAASNALVRLLGDQLNVKRAALASLRAVVSNDIGLGDDPETPAMGEQIRRWRQWHYQNQARGNAIHGDFSLGQFQGQCLDRTNDAGLCGAVIDLTPVPRDTGDGRYCDNSAG